MNKLKVNLNACFGIYDLEYEFDFSENRCVLIYAPNGMMKSSFAKTFDYISKNEKPSDLVYPERNTVAEILCDSKPIDPACIVVADAESQINSNDKITTLLASKDLKKQYDEIYQVLEKAKNEFRKKLKEVSQSSDCESELISTFKETEKDNFFDCLRNIDRAEIINRDKIFPQFRYNDIFDKKGNIEKFLKKHKELIQTYFNQYNNLLSKSAFFKKNEDGTSFGTYQAKQIIDSVDGNAFFSAKHKMVLSNSIEVTSKSQLESIVNGEINKILNDEKLEEIFKKIDKAITGNAELRAFKTALEKDKTIVLYLLNYEDFKRKTWIAYLGELQNELNELLSIYEGNRGKLSELLEKARSENKAWKEIVDIYNDRFHVPFRVSIENQEDVILKQDAAKLVFSYEGNLGIPVKKEQEELIGVLSRGERRAFFILHLLFELEARKKTEAETLLLLDDIADSFDYKNKYAIIEYICDLKVVPSFNQVIMTHNFDFYRTLDSRLNLGANVYMAVRNREGKILMEPGQYRKNFFSNVLVQNAEKADFFIGLIPFVRNIVEYTEGQSSDKYKKLTNCLHVKSEITVGEVCEIYNKTISKCSQLEMKDENKPMLQMIKETADRIVSEIKEDEIALERKLVLSIAIRLITEKYIIKKLNVENSEINKITANQTRVLIEKFCNSSLSEKSSEKLFKRVNLITPENIHLNTFMYEPLIDTSSRDLVDLYKNVRALVDSERQ